LAAAFALALATGAAAAQPQVPSDEVLRAEARLGLQRMMDGDLEGAIGIFQEIQKADAQSPLGYLLEADAVWWRIYYSTANLVDPDVFAATDLPTTKYDWHFQDLLNIALAKCAARIRAKEDVARSYLYQGMAYALRGRLAGLRDQDLPTARAGKKMRTALLKAVELDPSLTDAYLGLGIYNYFVDTLSAIVKLLRWIIGLPGGSRLEGLRQMELAAQKGDLSPGEAKFYLAKDYSRPAERQFDRSIKLFQELERDYHHNPFWPMMVASLNCRMGRTEPCETGYRDVLRRTAHAKNEVDEALHRSAHHALQRRHPNEKID
jgi:tetratricopeptide (TPR) repeat protein